jgi:hypothetical protein
MRSASRLSNGAVGLHSSLLEVTADRETKPLL